MKTINIKIIAVALFAVTMCVNVSAQQKGNQYLTNRFVDNWFISVGAGAQSYWGNPWSSVAGSTNFVDRASITYNMSIGKWITPSTGVRIQGFYAPTAKAFGKDIEMNMFNVHADVMFNLANAFGGYRESRVYSPILSMGAGYGQNELNNQTHYAMTANIGLINSFRVCRIMDVNLELGAMVAPKTFDGFVREAGYGKPDNQFDAVIQASVGVTFRLGAKGFQQFVEVPEVDLTPYNRKIKELEGELNTSNAKTAQLNNQIIELQNQPELEVVQAVVVPAIVMPAISTYFNLGSSVVGPKDMVQLEEVASIINQTPNTQYKLSGLIDYSTGSRELNEKLCKSRIESVFNALVKLGVNPNQLVKAEGTPASPSNNPILNRGVVTSPIN